MLQFQNVEDMYRGRVLKTAVAEAASYYRALCNQHCGTHIYIKNGIPYDQLTGEKHDCPMTRIGKMWTAHLGMIQMDRIESAPMNEIPAIIERQKNWNRKWDQAWYQWKETGIIPRTKEVESWK